MEFANVKAEGKEAVAVLKEGRWMSVSRLLGEPVTSVDDVIRMTRARMLSFAEVATEQALSDPEFLPAVRTPEKIFCIGLNYRKHAEETKAKIPEQPVVFSKFSNALAGDHAKVCIPEPAAEMDYEVELAIIIGREGRDIPENEALNYVFGYATANDISARALQNRSGQWLLGKSLDGFLPLGPKVVTRDQVKDPDFLDISLKLNGETRQKSNTSDMIFSCRQIIHYLSRYFTLSPGDVIITGTPSGVILGYPKAERVWIKAGDVTEASVEGLGTLTTTFTD